VVGGGGGGGVRPPPHTHTLPGWTELGAHTTFMRAMTYQLVLIQSCKYIAYQLDSSSKFAIRTFFLHFSQYYFTSNTTEDRGECTSDFFFFDVDVMTFQLIQSEVKLYGYQGFRIMGQ